MKPINYGKEDSEHFIKTFPKSTKMIENNKTKEEKKSKRKSIKMIQKRKANGRLNGPFERFRKARSERVNELDAIMFKVHTFIVLDIC